MEKDRRREDGIKEKQDRNKRKEVEDKKEIKEKERIPGRDWKDRKGKGLDMKEAEGKGNKFKK
jgi:hypothetical protein